MAKDAIDARKLKGAAAEYLKKSKFEKAAEVLEDLVHAEPKDVQHRLRLGDCYRKLDQPQKSLAQSDAAGRYYADQRQLITAIAAVQAIPAIDPRYAEAQTQRAEMPRRRRRKGAPSSRPLRRRIPAPRPPAPRSRTCPTTPSSRPSPRTWLRARTTRRWSRRRSRPAAPSPICSAPTRRRRSSCSRSRLTAPRSRKPTGAATIWRPPSAPSCRTRGRRRAKCPRACRCSTICRATRLSSW